MSHVETYEKLSELLGSGFKIHERAISDVSFQGNADAFRVFLNNVAQLKLEERPKLLGLFADRKQGTQGLTVIIGFGKEFQSVVLSVEVPGNEVLPSLYEVWNYAKWWEAESESFEMVRFESPMGSGGISWERS